MEAPVARTSVRDAINEILDDATEIETHAVVEDVAAQLAAAGLLDDPEFVQEVVASFVSDELRAELRQRRVVATDRGAVDFEKFEKRAMTIARRIFETVGGTHRKAITSMTRPDLLFCAERREKQSDGLLKWARFERSLAEVLPNDDVTVEDAIQESTFESIWGFHFSPTSLGNS